MTTSNLYMAETLLLISIALSVTSIISVYSCFIYSLMNINKIRALIMAPGLLCLIMMNISVMYLVSNYPYGWSINKFYIIGLPAAFCVLFFSRDHLFKKIPELNVQEKTIAKLYDLITYFIGGSMLSYMILMSLLRE